MLVSLSLITWRNLPYAVLNRLEYFKMKRKYEPRPRLPQVYITGNSVSYFEWRNNTIREGKILDAPAWLGDYWGMLISVGDEEVEHYIVWVPKEQRWESGEI